MLGLGSPTQPEGTGTLRKFGLADLQDSTVQYCGRNRTRSVSKDPSKLVPGELLVTPELESERDLGNEFAIDSLIVLPFSSWTSRQIAGVVHHSVMNAFGYYCSSPSIDPVFAEDPVSSRRGRDPDVRVELCR